MAVEGLTIKVGVDLTAIAAAEARVRALRADANGIGRGLPSGTGTPMTVNSAAQAALNKAAGIPGLDNIAQGAAEKEAAIKRGEVANRIAESQRELGGAKAPTPKSYPVGYNFGNEALITRNADGSIARYERGYNFAEEVISLPASQRTSGKSLFARAVDSASKYMPFGGMQGSKLGGANKLMSYAGVSGLKNLTGAGMAIVALSFMERTAKTYEQDIMMEGNGSVREVAARSMATGARDVLVGVQSFALDRLLDVQSLNDMLTSAASNNRTSAMARGSDMARARIGLRNITRSTAERVQAESDFAGQMQHIQNVTNMMQYTIDSINLAAEKDKQDAYDAFEQRAAGTGMVFDDAEKARYRAYLWAYIDERNKRDIARIDLKTGLKRGSWSGDMN